MEKFVRSQMLMEKLACYRYHVFCTQIFLNQFRFENFLAQLGIVRRVDSIVRTLKLINFTFQTLIIRLEIEAVIINFCLTDDVILVPPDIKINHILMAHLEKKKKKTLFGFGSYN